MQSQRPYDYGMGDHEYAPQSVQHTGRTYGDVAGYV